MPVLRCALVNVDCTWQTPDVDLLLAMTLQMNHMANCHQVTMAGYYEIDGAPGAPAHQQHPVISPEHLNTIFGTQGGNFGNCDLQNSTLSFHIQLPRVSLSSQNYQKIELIGKGNFGEAWKVQPKFIDRSQGQEFIMKEIICSQQDITISKNEIEMLKKCRHDSIVNYIEDFYEDNKILIIMEFCSGGDLAKFIEKQKESLPIEIVDAWVLQLTSGLRFIHKEKIIHRDLKPANIFLTTDKKLKIGDFGISKKLERTSGFASTRAAGTYFYMAPEILGGEKYNTMADMWSLGVIVFEIVTLKKPFHGLDWIQAISKEWL